MREIFETSARYRGKCRGIFFFVWILVLTGCSGTSPMKLEGETLVTVEWQPACSLGAEQPYFSVQTKTDGTVTYVGGAQAREVGVRTSNVDPRTADRLILDAERFVRGGGDSLTKSSTITETDNSSYCLQVTVEDGETKIVQRARSDARAARALIKTLDASVRPRQWACPARYGIDSPIGRRLGFPYCEDRPILSLYVSDHSTCFSGHIIWVYADGTVQYFAERIETERLSRATVDHQYSTLTRDEFDRLIAVVNELHLTGRRGCIDTVLGLECTDRTAITSFRTNNEKELDRVIGYLNQTGGIRRAVLAPHEGQCPAGERAKSELWIEASYVSSENRRVR